MVRPLQLHPDRFLGTSEQECRTARELFEATESLPIISPHGHTDPAWFASNRAFDNPSDLLIRPDHYVLRMLYSQGISMDKLGIARSNAGNSSDTPTPLESWRCFARNFGLFAGTPSELWLNYVFNKVFGIDVQLCEETADEYFNTISDQLNEERFLPRQILERFNVECIATTEGATDTLEHHRILRSTNMANRVITTFRPDDIVDPAREDFCDNLQTLAEQTNEDVAHWQGYLAAIRQRREFFRSMGATATDHGHPTAATANLNEPSCQRLLDACRSGEATAEEKELFRAQMLTEMATMSVEDGMVMQLHPGSYRNHNPFLFDSFGRDKGADIPVRVEYVNALKPLLDLHGNNPNFTLILFTLDESNYSRELAPLAGHYPALRLGPAWWFHDSPEGMLRFRQQTTETAGFYNTVGFNDDTRALLSIPARHDLARRIDAKFLAQWVLEHRIDLARAREIAIELAYAIPKSSYRLG